MVSDLAKKFKRKPDFLCKKVQTFCVPAPFRFPRRQKPRGRLPKEPLGPVSRPGHALRRPAPGSRLGKSTAVPTFRAPRTTPPADRPEPPRRPPCKPRPRAIHQANHAQAKSRPQPSASLQSPKRDLAAPEALTARQKSGHQVLSAIGNHKHIPKKRRPPNATPQAIPALDHAAPQTARNPAPSTRQTAPTQKAVHSPALPCKPPKRNFAAPEARAPSHSSPGARHLQGHVHYRNLRVPRVSTAAENPSRTYGPPILLFSITSPSGFRRSPGDTAFPFQRQARSAAFRLRGRL